MSNRVRCQQSFPCFFFLFSNFLIKLFAKSLLLTEMDFDQDFEWSACDEPEFALDFSSGDFDTSGNIKTVFPVLFQPFGIQPDDDVRQVRMNCMDLHRAKVVELFGSWLQSEGCEPSGINAIQTSIRGINVKEYSTVHTFIKTDGSSAVSACVYFPDVVLACILFFVHLCVGVKYDTPQMEKKTFYVDLLMFLAETDPVDILEDDDSRKTHFKNFLFHVLKKEERVFHRMSKIAAVKRVFDVYHDIGVLCFQPNNVHATYGKHRARMSAYAKFAAAASEDKESKLIRCSRDLEDARDFLVSLWRNNRRALNYSSAIQAQSLMKKSVY